MVDNSLSSVAALLLGFGRRPCARPRRSCRSPRIARPMTFRWSTLPRLPPTSAQTPISATGLIAYEFRGSACEGYTSNFRQMTEMERSEGDPLSMQVNAMSFEDADGKSMRFRDRFPRARRTRLRSRGPRTRGADDDLRVELTKPQAETLDFGHDVLFPTQHIERLIEAAKHGGGVMQARVYDGSDTGAKIFATMSVIGKEATKPGDDAEPPRRSAGYAAGRSSSPISTKPRPIPRPNTRFRSIFTRTACRAASSSTTAHSRCARACASSRFCRRRPAQIEIVSDVRLAEGGRAEASCARATASGLRSACVGEGDEQRFVGRQIVEHRAVGKPGQRPRF